MAKLLKSIAKLVQILQSTVLIMEGFVLLVFPFKIAVKREKTGRKGSLITYLYIPCKTCSRQFLDRFIDNKIDE